MGSLPKAVKPTAEQERALSVARVAFMIASPFYSHLYYSIGKEVITRDIPTLATDGRHIMINPDYFCRFTAQEQVFELAHEMSHLVCRHAQRCLHYAKEGTLRGLPFDRGFANVCADYVINADLVETGVGQINPAWLWDKDIKGEELWEDVYERLFKQGKGKPPPRGRGRGPGKPDAWAEGNDGRFDDVLDPPTDPVTGEADLPGEHEFKEAVARAASVAKAMGKMPGSLQRMVDELLAPQVSWKDRIRLLMTGRIGAKGETWKRPNRRRLVLNPIMILPGRDGYGCETVVVGVDTSGSIGERELAVFLSEVGGILSDVRPRRIVVIGCDAKVTQVDEVTSLDEFECVRANGIKGGGGTRFEPVFDYVERA